MDDRTLRCRIYGAFAATGSPPTAAEVADWAGDPDAGSTGLRRLHDAHAIVLDEQGEIRMALPFSGVETPHRVTSGGGLWYANCAWDALAIPLLLELDATICSEWLDDGAALELVVSAGELSAIDGFVHFGLPARNWWDDIVET